MTTGRTPPRIGIRGEIADRGKEFATKALDRSARRTRPVSLTITPEDGRV
jgi:hypothetical protein